MSESIELRRELRIIAKQMQDMGIEASCLFNAADRIEKLETALKHTMEVYLSTEAALKECVIERDEARKALEDKTARPVYNARLNNRIEKLEAALRVAAGYISTKEGHTDQHPQDVYDWIVSVALAEEKKDD